MSDGPVFTFVDWGDGYFVYENGKYIGKDDQIDLIDEMVRHGLAEKRHIAAESEEDTWFAADDLAAVKTAPGPMPYPPPWEQQS